MKEKLGHFFHKMTIFQNKKKGAYQPMNMNPYLGFRKAVNFKSFFSNYSDVVQESKWKNINKYDA